MSSLIKRFQAVNKTLAKRQLASQNLDEANRFIIDNIDYQKACIAS